MPDKVDNVMFDGPGYKKYEVITPDNKSSTPFGRSIAASHSFIVNTMSYLKYKDILTFMTSSIYLCNR